jgi:DNA ligase (NAD+)
MNHLQIPDWVKARWQDLVTRIHGHDEAYYHNEDPVLSDAEYDALRHELQVLEEKYPPLVAQDQGSSASVSEWAVTKSPGQRVGCDPSPLFTSVHHLWPLYSLEKVLDFQGFRDFSEKAARFLGLPPGHDFTWVAEPKIDGLTLVLRYEKGLLVRGATRGNGIMGEDVTANVRTIRTIPHVLSQYDGPDVMEIRGEVYILQQDFQDWNAQRQDQALPPLSNPRNAAAGSLRQIDAEMTASRPLRFMPHGSTLGDDLYPNIETYEKMLSRLDQWGFQSQPMMRLCWGSRDVADYFQFMLQQRGGLGYEIDGVVYKLDDLSHQKRLGHSSRAPRYAVAEKFPAHHATTHVLHIDVQVGRTGVVTPVAHLHPVLVGGVTVTRASMHNANELERKDLHIGDTVLIHRAGDVIPQILQVILEKRPLNSLPFVFPTHCPSCQNALTRKEGAVAWRCTAGFHCPAQAIGRLRHCVSRDAMDIAGLGLGQLSFLYERQLLRMPGDLFRLKTQDLVDLEGWGKKSATQVVQAIKTRRQVSLHRWIYALGIPSVGYITAKALADHYKTRGNFEQAFFGQGPKECLRASDMEESWAGQELLTISGVGEDVAHELMDFMHSQKDWMQDLASFVAIVASDNGPNPTHTTSPLYGKNIVFTGTLPTMTRAEAKERAEQWGARVLSGLSRHVDFLVSGEKSGQKVRQAREWNIAILDAEQWQALLINSAIAP